MYAWGLGAQGQEQGAQPEDRWDRKLRPSFPGTRPVSQTIRRAGEVQAHRTACAKDIGMRGRHLENPFSDQRVGAVGGRGATKLGGVQTMGSTECLTENLGLKKCSMHSEDFPLRLQVRALSLALSAHPGLDSTFTKEGPFRIQTPILSAASLLSITLFPYQKGQQIPKHS